MSYYDRFEDLLEKMYESDPEKMRSTPYVFLGAIKSAIHRHEEAGKQTIPIKEIVNCLEIACEDNVKDKEFKLSI